MKTARRQQRTTTCGRTTHHRLLGVPDDASPDDIKTAYRRLARMLHPDTNPGDPDAAYRFQRLTDAYETLLAEASTAEHHRNPASAADPPASARPARPPETGWAADAGDAGATAPVGPSPGRREPVELPGPLADGLTRLAITLPAMWVFAGAPGVRDRVPADVSPLHAAITVAAGIVTWFVVGAVLWSRAPALREHSPGWRSPGWEGTALLWRVVAFLLLSWASTAIILGPFVAGAPDPSPMRVPLWLMLMVAGWVISGRLPQQLGYRSRQDRLRLSEEEGLPRRTVRRRSPGRRERVRPKHPDRWSGRSRPTPLSF